MSESEAKSFMWKGKEVKTVGDLVSALSQLKSKEEGQAFMKAYRLANEHADANAGYCVGYIGGSDDAATKRRSEIHSWIGVGHPVFKAGY